MNLKEAKKELFAKLTFWQKMVWVMDDIYHFMKKYIFPAMVGLIAGLLISMIIW